MYIQAKEKGPEEKTQTLTVQSLKRSGICLPLEEGLLNVIDWVVVKFCSKNVVKRFVEVIECLKMEIGHTISL